MTLLLIVALALFSYAALLVARVALAPRARAADRIAQIDAYTFGGAPAPVSDERPSPVEALGAALAGRASEQRLAQVRTRLLAAGLYGTSAERYLGSRALTAVAIPVLMLALVLMSDMAPGMSVVLVGLGAFCGWALPEAMLARRGRLRLERIDRGMPELVDLLVVGVESGMGFGGALRAAAGRVEGPLGDELKLMLREQSLGASNADALNHMLERGDTPAVRAFVRTINQGERLGVSIGQMMRSLAEEMRKRRKAKAEELAHKAPVKILFPLVFLIFPAIFIVLLAPAVMKLSESLS